MGFKSPLAHTENPQVRRPAGSSRLDPRAQEYANAYSGHMSERHEVRLTMSAVPAEVLAVYARRGMSPPEMASPYPPAALWAYEPRWRHRLYATTHGYFWLPCPLCERAFGGHEVTDSIPDPTDEQHRLWMSVCPECSAERNGGSP